ncbi:MAG: hypothetical protein DRJ02_04715, partial [Bacteroidetes bacterium]
MKLSGKQKKAFIIIGSIVLLLAIVVVAINLIIGHLIENKVREALDKQKEKKYNIEVRTVRANILTGNINLKDLTITPDSLFLELLKKGDADKSTAIELSIPTLRFAGIRIYQAITSQSIDLRNILFKNAEMTVIMGKKSKNKPKELKQQGKLNIDSIYIAGINGIEIGAIKFRNCKLHIYDLVNDKMMLENREMEFEITDFYLEELEGNQDFFSLHLEDVKLDLKQEKFMIPGGNYSLYFGRIYFDLSRSVLELEDMIFTPTYEDKYKLAKKLKFTSEIYDISVKKIRISSFDIRRLINLGELAIDSVRVNSLKLSILMDKRLPFNLDRRPKLPHQALKNMKMPLFIGRVSLKDSYLE